MRPRGLYPSVISRRPAAVLGDEVDASGFEERLVDQLRTITRVPIAARV